MVSSDAGYPSKHVCLREMFPKEKYLSLEKVIPIDKFANHSKRNGLQGWLAILLVSLHGRLKNLPAEKRYILLNGITIQYRNMFKKTGPKVGCFVGFCHHHLTTMSAHTHAYRYPLAKSGTKIGLSAIALCRKDWLYIVCQLHAAVD